MTPVDAYARSVVLGAVPAGKYHRLACARHLKDRGREGMAAFPYRFDFALAERFYRFAAKLKHYKGEWAGQFIVLRPDQIFRKGVKYGWVHIETGLRRFRNSYEEIPRKNGKSLEMAVEMLYLTFFDGERGAAGYCAATKRDQALIVFGDCKKLAASSGLKTRLTLMASNIHDTRTDSKLEPLSADYNSMDGLNIHAACLDELHAMKTRGTIAVVETATGARRQPLINKITTAGDDPVSPCGDEHAYACQILDGVLDDETYFAFIAHADTDDDWTLPETAAKANPSYGISVNADDLKGKVVKAKGITAAAAEYKQKHLNIWENATAPCLSVEGWRKGQSKGMDREAFAALVAHDPCYIGIDLASKIDLCDLTAMFPPRPGRSKTLWLKYTWTPADTLTERAHRDRAPYRSWVDAGWLRTTEGTRIDHDVVIAALLDLRSRFDIEQIGFDPWHADKLIEELVKVHGFAETQVVAVPQTYAGMSSACLRVQADILAGEVDANGNPLAEWAVSNTVGQRDGKDNLMFAKGKSRGRIDPVIAPTIATALWLRQPVTVMGDGYFCELGA